jgi:tRNA(fMet)-specific endonuclease VapC
MIYYLDTNICIHVLNDKTQHCLNKIGEIGIQSVLLPSVVVSELFYGAYKSAKREQNLVKIRIFIHQFAIVGLDSNSMEVYGELRAELERKGTPIGANDLFIAAIAKANKAIFVTNNTKEFSRVSGLILEDWTQ